MIPIATSGVEIVAHRGASSEAPENTLAAIELAWEQDDEAVEVDIHQTRDGHLVIMHDADTARTTGVGMKIAEKTLEEIRRLDAGRWKGAEYAGEKVPTLEEVLDSGGGHRRFFLEIKSRGVSLAKVEQAILNADLTSNRVVWMSFIEGVVREARKFAGGSPVLWLVEGPLRQQKIGSGITSVEELIRRAREYGADGIGISKDWEVDAAFAATVRKAGLKLYVWTVNDPRLARELVEAGVNGFISDCAWSVRGQLA